MLLVGLAYAKHVYEDMHGRGESEEDEKGWRGMSCGTLKGGVSWLCGDNMYRRRGIQ